MRVLGEDVSARVELLEARAVERDVQEVAGRLRDSRTRIFGAFPVTRLALAEE